MKFYCVLFLWALVVCPQYLTAQLVAIGADSSIVTPLSLAQSFAGTGVTISNITTNMGNGAHSKQFALFTNSNSNLGLSSGMMLCTGYADDFNNVGNTIGSFTSLGTGGCANGGICGPGDPDLNTLTMPFTTNDAAVFEFDFVPLYDTITFRYVFASEEYPEFVCDQYNDVFGFFLSGPGITGTQNVATIPGSTPTMYVGINSLNPGVPGGFNPAFPNCAPPQGSLANSSLYIDNTISTTLQFDGLTTILDAVAIVISGQTYHIKLAIADAADGSYDSAVFFETSSFRSSETKTAIKPIESALQVTVYQNPSTGIVQIEHLGNEEINILVLDHLGNVLLFKTSTDILTEVNLQDLPAGVYYLSLRNEKGTVVQKVVKV